jgi:hypothetical protein
MLPFINWPRRVCIDSRTLLNPTRRRLTSRPGSWAHTRTPAARPSSSFPHTRGPAPTGRPQLPVVGPSGRVHRQSPERGRGGGGKGGGRELHRDGVEHPRSPSPAGAAQLRKLGLQLAPRQQLAAAGDDGDVGVGAGAENQSGYGAGVEACLRVSPRKRRGPVLSSYLVPHLPSVVGRRAATPDELLLLQTRMPRRPAPRRRDGSHDDILPSGTPRVAYYCRSRGAAW